MKNSRVSRWGLIVGVVFVVALVGAGIFVAQGQYLQQLQLASGFKAKTLAAGLFIQGLDQERLEAEDSGFNSLFALITARIDTEAQKVTCSLLGTGLFSATAIRIPGFGAVLLSGRSEEEVRAQLRSPPVTIEPSDLAVAPSPDPGYAEAVARTFVETDIRNPKRTRAVLVLVGGKIVAERYAPGIAPETRLLSWSMAKSFTNALIGQAVGQGLLDIGQPAVVPEWTVGDPRAAITIDQLLRMSSGLAFSETYNDQPISDVNQMLFLEPDFAAFTASRPLAAAPDTVWNYSSGTTNILQRLLRQKLGDGAYWSYPAEQLFAPLGMASAEWGVDASGTFAGSSYLYATARDYAKFGLLALHNGVWNGQRLLPEGWMTYSLTPTKTNPQGTYGAQFWLNAQQVDYPEMPADLSYADGHNGQEIFFCPSLDLVAVRLGMTWEGDWGSREFLAALRKTIGK